MHARTRHVVSLSLLQWHAWKIIGQSEYSKKNNQNIGQLDSGFQRLLYVVVSERRVTSGQVSTSYHQFVVSFNNCFFFPKGFWGTLSKEEHCCGKYASKSH
jgi:hypothetical protein